MKRQLAVGATLLALGLGAAAPAHAQYTTNDAPGISPRHVIAIVRSTGMTPVSPPIRRGARYVLVASDRSGAQLRVVLDAYDGTILRVRPVVAMRPYRAPYGVGAIDPYAPRPRVAIVPPDRDLALGAYEVDPYTAPPPRGVPNARVAVAPNPPASHALAAHHPQTPLPRPRQALASRDTSDTTGTTPKATAPLASPTNNTTKAAAPAAAAPSTETKIAAPTASVPPAVKPVAEGSWPVPAKTSEPKPEATKSGELKLVPVAPLN